MFAPIAAAKERIQSGRAQAQPKVVRGRRKSGIDIFASKSATAPVDRDEVLTMAAPHPQNRTEDRGHVKFHTAATRAFAAMNSSRSALIWSAFVVGMPCGKPLYVFKIAPFTNFAVRGAESA